MYEIDFNFEGSSYVAMVEPLASGYHIDVYRRFGPYIGDGVFEDDDFVSSSTGLVPLSDLIGDRLRAREFTRAIA
jgi:hypothetical protein